MAKRYVTNYKSLPINIITTVRPLLNPSQRIVLPNVSPIIPHSFIEKFLTDHNIRLTSKLIFLPAGWTFFRTTNILWVIWCRHVTRLSLYINDKNLFRVINKRMFISYSIISCSALFLSGFFRFHKPCHSISSHARVRIHTKQLM